MGAKRLEVCGHVLARKRVEAGFGQTTRHVLELLTVHRNDYGLLDEFRGRGIWVVNTKSVLQDSGMAHGVEELPDLFHGGG